ncbi:hypothetical protein PMZ80_001718 [Knufia obscura]|uniref:Fe2OG dioxygenase domain-containing protein n=1 Tax=Knufia obscura TaxID=1635080 RepID=A0ABR0S3X8_9EURO|nr:hypothetical protein PMZ80_001718 [Knufia obscura]
MPKKKKAAVNNRQTPYVPPNAATRQKAAAKKKKPKKNGKQPLWYHHSRKWKKTRIPLILRLPIELRDMIYSYLFVGTTIADITITKKGTAQRRRGAQSIMLVNKKLRADAGRAFFSQCKFEIPHFKLHHQHIRENPMSTLNRISNLTVVWTPPPKSTFTTTQSDDNLLVETLPELKNLTIDLLGRQYLRIDPENSESQPKLHESMLAYFKKEADENVLPIWIKNIIAKAQASTLSFKLFLTVYYAVDPSEGSDLTTATISWPGKEIVNTKLVRRTDWDQARAGLTKKYISEPADVEPVSLSRSPRTPMIDPVPRTRNSTTDMEKSGNSPHSNQYRNITTSEATQTSRHLDIHSALKMATETITQTNNIHLNGHANANGTSSLPPFPDDVPTAPLLALSLAKLQNNDPEEINRLIRACEDLGFFYLDLQGPGDGILDDADKLFKVGEELYDLPLEEKQKYDFMHKNSYFGYKGFGANVVDKTGRTDRNEFYNISKDDILNLSDPLPAPTVLSTQRPLFASFMQSSHAIITMILTHLNTHLGLPPHTLQNLHRLQSHSGDQVRLIKAPPQPVSDRQITLGEHTDFGSVTVLFNRLGGLQVLPPGKDASWCYVKPIPGHAIINLGDAMAKFTNGLLRSNIHRVVSPPGEQADATRYSLVYFARPENGVLMRRLEGSDRIPELDGEDEGEMAMTAKDWIIRRALGHRHAINKEAAMDFESFQGTERLSRREGR